MVGRRQQQAQRGYKVKRRRRRIFRNCRDSMKKPFETIFECLQDLSLWMKTLHIKDSRFANCCHNISCRTMIMFAFKWVKKGNTYVKWKATFQNKVFSIHTLANIRQLTFHESVTQLWRTWTQYLFWTSFKVASKILVDFPTIVCSSWLVWKSMVCFKWAKPEPRHSL